MDIGHALSGGLTWLRKRALRARGYFVVVYLLVRLLPALKQTLPSLAARPAQPPRVARKHPHRRRAHRGAASSGVTDEPRSLFSVPSGWPASSTTWFRGSPAWARRSG